VDGRAFATNADVSARIEELKTEVSVGVIDGEIRKRSARVKALQGHLDRMLKLVEARAIEYAEGSRRQDGSGGLSYLLGRCRISGANSRKTLNAAVDANETPAVCAMLPTPFHEDGPHILDTAAAPLTAAISENENLWRPSGCLAMNPLTRACPARGKNP
jgi:hypothetical protein